MPPDTATGDPLLSDDPIVIAGWAAEILAARLIRKDGIAQYSLAGEGRIYRMAYLPGIAWVMYCDTVYQPTWKDRINKPKWQAFTRPDMRRQGICDRLCGLAGWPNNTPTCRRPKLPSKSPVPPDQG